MRVLVTGGAGFIGRHLVRALLQQGATVLILDNLSRRNSARPLPAGAAFYQADIGNLAILQQVLSADRFDVIYHLAAQSQVMSAERAPGLAHATNVTGTRYLAQAAAEAGIQRIVFTSSREVYGEIEEAEDLPVAEDAILRPRSQYAVSKYLAEELLNQMAARSYGSLQVSILRLTNVYGPGDVDRVIPHWLEQASYGIPLTVYGGEQVLDFVPVSLVVQALLLAGAGHADGAGPINIGSGQGTTLQQLAARIQPDAEHLCLLPARDIEVVRFVADVSRMRQVLGLEPPADPLVGLEELLKQPAEEARHADVTHA